ncbi:hypothetical protein J6X13_03435 [Candidatus Saccharibacteria bacterium]|nr:hypothetical protein [Candidatus Saccharibacteria bacterium]
MTAKTAPIKATKSTKQTIAKPRRKAFLSCIFLLDVSKCSETVAKGDNMTPYIK